MQSKTKAPFGWVGGKSKLAKDIVTLMPEHRRYIEVFGGSLSVLYAKPKATGAGIEIVNDINSELINLHRAIRNYPDTLSIYLNQLLTSREIFADIKNKRLKPKNKIERAAFYFYLLSQSFGSKGSHFAMSKSRKPKNIYRDFTQLSKRLKGVSIENMSFEKLIATYDKEDSFFYCDPPYVGTESYYDHTDGFGIKEHKQLATILSSIKGKFLVSYNDCDTIRDPYDDFKIIQTKEIGYSLAGVKRQKRVKEVFITNY